MKTTLAAKPAPVAHRNKTSATRKTIRGKKLTELEHKAVRYAVNAQPLSAELPYKDLVFLEADDLLLTGEMSDGLSAPVQTAVRAAVATIVANTKAHANLRSSYTAGDGGCWKGVIRDKKTSAVVWECPDQHSARDTDRRVRGGVIPCAKTCSLVHLARVLAGTVTLKEEAA